MTSSAVAPLWTSNLDLTHTEFDNGNHLVGRDWSAASGYAAVVLDANSGNELHRVSLGRVRAAVGTAPGKVFTCSLSAEPVGNEVGNATIVGYDLTANGLTQRWSTPAAGTRCAGFGVAGDGSVWLDTGSMLNPDNGSLKRKLADVRLTQDFSGGVQRVSRIERLMLDGATIFATLETAPNGETDIPSTRDVAAYDLATGALIAEQEGELVGVVGGDLIFSREFETVGRASVNRGAQSFVSTWSVPSMSTGGVVRGGDLFVVDGSGNDTRLLKLNVATGASTELAKQDGIGAPVLVGDRVVAMPFVVSPSGAVTPTFTGVKATHPIASKAGVVLTTEFLRPGMVALAVP